MIQPWPWESVVRDTAHWRFSWMSAKQRALLSTADQREGTHNLNSEHNTTCNGATEQSRWSSQARCWVIKGTLDCVFTDWGGPDHEKFPCSRAQYVDQSVLHDLCQSGVIIRHTPVQQWKPTPLSIWIEQSRILYMHDAWLTRFFSVAMLKFWNIKNIHPSIAYDNFLSLVWLNIHSVQLQVITMSPSQGVTLVVCHTMSHLHHNITAHWFSLQWDYT